jgi:hypothetical protein
MMMGMGIPRSQRRIGTYVPPMKGFIKDRVPFQAA